MTIDYKSTLLLPKTSFEMKAKDPARADKGGMDLPAMEHTIRRKWFDLYDRIREQRKGKPIRMIHDGPPYANGDIHFGHAMNKILKDILTRHLTMMGFDAPFRPGWDCHGLPIERKVQQVMLQATNFNPSKMTVNVIRGACHKEALHWVEVQTKQFESLGILADWNDPYLTYHETYEQGVLTLLQKLVKDGYVTRKLRPIAWCVHDATALAEAELVYDQSTSHTMYVEFEINEKIPEIGGRIAQAFSLVAWTTTPWTLPANVALAVNSELEYTCVQFQHPKTGKVANMVIATSLVPEVMIAGKVEKWSDIARFKGDTLLGLTYRSPLTPIGMELAPEDIKTGVVIAANFVTDDQGTGVVHIAPAHGQEDFVAAQDNKLRVDHCPVDGQGFYLVGTHPKLDGENVTKFGINDFLATELGNRLWQRDRVKHSIPHCWRCKNPTIVRATPQWFIELENHDLRQRVLHELNLIDWHPKPMQNRMEAMVYDRPDWCISRQRYWGVAIPSVECSRCGHHMLTVETIAVCKEEGSDYWLGGDDLGRYASALACEKCGNPNLNRGSDILDVWFESGASFANVLPDNTTKVTYLEGSDQHRGWFQHALLLGLATLGHSPMNEIITHGWVVDQDGKKFAKSAGTAPQVEDTVNKYGADVFRMFVASQDTFSDLRVSDLLLDETRNVYNKWRNTLRFILGNCQDFNEDLVEKPKDFGSHLIDLYILHQLNRLIADCRDAYGSYAFTKVYHRINEFLVTDLSGVYFSVIKDRLYAESHESKSRHAAIYTLTLIFDNVTRLIAPILPHTAEELWSYLANSGSVHMADFPVVDTNYVFDDQDWKETWKSLFEYRGAIFADIDVLKKAKKITSESQVKVRITNKFALDQAAQWRYAETLRDLCLLAEVTVIPVHHDELVGIEVTVSDLPRCERCWRCVEGVQDGVCKRCKTAMVIRVEEED